MDKYKQVNNFLGKLDDGQFGYLHLTVGFVHSLKMCIRKFNLSREHVCRYFSLEDKDYIAFTRGNWTYDLHQMSLLNALYMEMEQEISRQNSPIQVAADE